MKIALKIALYQGPGAVNDPQAAFTLMQRKAAEAKARGADVLLLPEMYLSGYNIGPENARRCALTAAGLAPARRFAKEQGIALAFGYPELVGERVANAVVLIGPDGEILLNYRKTHLFGELDRAMFEEVGAQFPVARLGGYTVGLLICYDIEFPEPARRLALAGADIILVPTASMEPYDQVARHVIPARAYENQVYIAYANHSGQDDGLSYIGLSSICGPDGKVLALAGTGEEMLLAEVAPEHHAAVRRADPLLADRRPALYGPLVK
ncbi:carbon-nitrogen hydrolase family protein [Acidocella sp.]|uniref:carbon-nitrogen hydrolase family protein n=1 Tax=Acidocella sp. TaxID=50710 RepID=UPI002622D7F1|nr:carbon-nitrogen hydrolase family protein [Acidocella sp.]MDD2796005.1 carbon-nitrogen hydrolase family protein [Acidocella sp.]